MKDIFTDLYNRVVEFFTKSEEKEETKDVARNRLKLVLMQDRTNLNPRLLERLRGEMIDLLSKYVVMDKDLLELNFTPEDDQLALMLSIPVIRAKDEEEIEDAIKAEDAEKERIARIVEKAESEEVSKNDDAVEDSEEESKDECENESEDETEDEDEVVENNDCDVSEEVLDEEKSQDSTESEDVVRKSKNKNNKKNKKDKSKNTELKQEVADVDLVENDDKIESADEQELK